MRHIQEIPYGGGSMSKVIKLSEYINENKVVTPKVKTAPKRNKKINNNQDENRYKQKNYTFEKKQKKKQKKKSSTLGFSKRSNYSRCKNSAIYSLAMREHSRLELKNKLTKKEYAENVDLEKLLDELEENNYLNEERFIESFIRYRSGRGQGINKISNELKQRGINNVQINIALQEAEIDWFKLAKEQNEKKFGLQKPEDFKEKARQMRFLSGRGFDFDEIRASVD